MHISKLQREFLSSFHPLLLCFLPFLPSVVRNLEGIVYLLCLTSWLLMTTGSQIHWMFFCLCLRLLPVSMWQSPHPQISATSPLHFYDTTRSPPVSVPPFPVSTATSSSLFWTQMSWSCPGLVLVQISFTHSRYFYQSSVFRYQL